MFIRNIEEKISTFFKKDKKALLITGARQVGKTYTIRKFGESNFKSFIEINFLENKEAISLFKDAKNTKEILLRISAVSNKPLIPNDTLIFFDEIQECSDIETAIKFLVEEGSYRYILSGSLLGVELQNIRSWPVGFIDIYEMYPLDFCEFALANGVSSDIIENLKVSFEKRILVDDIIHQKMLDLFMLYIIVGGMPAAVKKYIQTNNLQEVLVEQNAILTLYKKDIAKYDFQNKLYLEDIFNLIPSELNSKNKRFVLKDLNENFKFSRYKNSFLWLINAGVALSVFSVAEPNIPLLLNKSSNLFKLFLSDVGLLTSMFSDGVQIKILNKEIDINFGAIFENIVAQELKAHGFDLYYYNSKKNGEVDFIIEQNGEVVLIEVKSGKNYNRHIALDNVLESNRNITNSYVFYNGNVKLNGRITYLPIYMIMFLKKYDLTTPLIYKLNIDELKK